MAYYSTPVLTALSPSTVIVGSSATAITIMGTGFAQGATTVTLANNSLAVTYVSPTELQVTLPQNLFKSTGGLTLELSNPPPGGGTSSGASVNVVNPVPVLNSLSPASAQIGAADTTLAVSGAAFEASSIVLWNGAALSTSYDSGSGLSAVIPAADLMTATSATVTVRTPGPGGGTSSGATFTVTAPPHGGGGDLGDLMLTLLLSANLTLHGPKIVRWRAMRHRARRRPL